MPAWWRVGNGQIMTFGRIWIEFIPHPMKIGKLQSECRVTLSGFESDTSFNRMRVLLFSVVLGIGVPMVDVLNAVPDSTSSIWIAEQRAVSLPLMVPNE